tara:strand:+ start:6804 stop:8018 length:1215 start_codon:yes stop_codon:yes gene_type:complete
MEKLVIIGAGQAAIQCINSLKKEGYSGEITLVGEEEHLPYQRPPLSKGFLDDSVNKERLYFKKLEFYIENQIQLKLGNKVLKVDLGSEKVFLSDQTELEFDKLVFATGSKVRKLDFPGNELDSVHYLRGLDDAVAIKADLNSCKNLAVIGAGYIGLEVAAVAAQKNINVTVIEMADRVMNRTVDPQISEYYLGLHQKNGVEFKFNTSLKEIRGNDRPEYVICSDLSEVKADTVIIGAGVIPDTDLASEAGIDTNNGILVDEYGQTNFEKIYACGDCTNHPNKILNKNLRLESVHNAMEQSKTVAFNILNNPLEYSQVPWFWSDQYDHKLQIVGLSGEHDTVTMRGEMSDNKFMLFYTKNSELLAVDSINNPKEFLISRKLMGKKVKIDVEMISDPATDLNDLIQ